MKKQTKKTVRNVVIIMGILAVLILIGYFATKPLSIGGASLLSLDKVDLTSSNSYFSGETWVLTFTANSLGQSYFGSFDPQDFEDETSGDLRPTKDFEISIEYEDTKCKYAIKGSSLDAVRDVDLVEWTYVPFVNPCDETEARSRTSNVKLYGKYGNSITCFAVGSPTSSVIKRIDNPDVSADYTIEIEAGDRSGSKTFNTLEGTTSGPISDFAYSVWNGNLDSGKACPSQASYLGAYVNGNWRIIDEDDYEDYDNAYDDMMRFSNQDAYKDTMRRAVEDVQSTANQARVSRNFGTIMNSGSLSNARVELATDTPLQFPVTTLYIKASALGVFTPVPDFRFKTATSECFKTGTEGSILFSLENRGEKGGFTAFATCPGVFTGTRNVQGTLDTNEVKTFAIPLSAQASQKETGSCTITVESTGKTITKSVNVCVDPQITCEVPYPKTFCGISGASEAIVQCSQDGATRSVIEVCQSGYTCEIKSGEGKCVFDDGGDGGFWDSIVGFFKGIGNFFKGIFDGTVSLFLAIKYFLMIVGGLFTLFASKNLLDLVKDLKNLAWVKWLIASALAIGAGWLLYLFIGGFIFWLILLGLLVYNIFFSQLSVFLNLRKVIKKRK